MELLRNPPTSSEFLDKATRIPAFTPCVYPDDWTFSAGARILLRDLNLDADFSVQYQTEVTSTSSVSAIYDAAVTRAQSVYDHRVNISNSAGLNWPNADVFYNFPFNRSYLQTCVVHPVSAVRVRDHWYIDNRITDHSILQYLPRVERRYLSELIRPEENEISLIPLTLNLAANESTSETIEGTKTFTIDRPSDVTPSHISVMTVEQNPALQESLSMSDLSIQRVGDALAPSSLAILFMPLVSTLIPLAALAQATSTAVVAYTIVSCVLSVVPLAIKGIELIYIAQQPHTAVTVRFVSSIDGSIIPHAVAEVFAARCSTVSSVKPTGIAFLVAALLCMILGVWFEIFALRVRNKRAKRRRLVDELSASLIHLAGDDQFMHDSR